MNEIIKSLLERKSVRSFTDEKVPDSLKEIIIKCATEAPTAGNQQLYTILDITDDDIKEMLALSCDNQPFIGKASVVLIFCADCKKWYDAYLSIGLDARKPSPGDMLLAVEDAMISAQNAVVAAQSLGLGSCYIGDILEHRDYHKKLLSLPDYVMPIGMLVIGYPSESAKNREKPQRADIRHLVHENAYRTLSGDELKEMLGYKKGAATYEEWLTAFCKRKYESEFSLEMSESARDYIKEYE